MGGRGDAKTGQDLSTAPRRASKLLGVMIMIMENCSSDAQNVCRTVSQKKDTDKATEGIRTRVKSVLKERHIDKANAGRVSHPSKKIRYVLAGIGHPT